MMEGSSLLPILFYDLLVLPVGNPLHMNHHLDILVLLRDTPSKTVGGP